MGNKINVAEILKDKPQGTKLYDWLHNIDVELDTISTTDTETVVWCTNKTDNNKPEYNDTDNNEPESLNKAEKENFIKLNSS